MRTESATLERSGAFQRSASRNHATRLSRAEHDTGLTLKPVVLVVGETGGIFFITPVVAIAVPQSNRHGQPISAQTKNEFSDGDDREPNNPHHWMPVPIPNTTNEKFD